MKTCTTETTPTPCRPPEPKTARRRRDRRRLAKNPRHSHSLEQPQPGTANAQMKKTEESPTKGQQEKPGKEEGSQNKKKKYGLFRFIGQQAVAPIKTTKTISHTAMAVARMLRLYAPWSRDGKEVYAALGESAPPPPAWKTTALRCTLWLLAAWQISAIQNTAPLSGQIARGVWILTAVCWALALSRSTRTTLLEWGVLGAAVAIAVLL